MEKPNFVGKIGLSLFTLTICFLLTPPMLNVLAEKSYTCQTYVDFMAARFAAATITKAQVISLRFGPVGEREFSSDVDQLEQSTDAINAVTTNTLQETVTDILKEGSLDMPLATPVEQGGVDISRSDPTEGDKSYPSLMAYFCLAKSKETFWSSDAGAGIERTRKGKGFYVIGRGLFSQSNCWRYACGSNALHKWKEKTHGRNNNSIAGFGPCPRAPAC